MEDSNITDKISIYLLYFCIAIFALTIFYKIADGQEIIDTGFTPEIQEIIEEINEPKPDEGPLERPITLENQPKPQRSLLQRISSWFYKENTEIKSEEKPNIFVKIIENANYIIRQEDNIYYATTYQSDENGCISFSNVVICGSFVITKFR